DRALSVPHPIADGTAINGPFTLAQATLLAAFNTQEAAMETAHAAAEGTKIIVTDETKESVPLTQIIGENELIPAKPGKDGGVGIAAANKGQEVVRTHRTIPPCGNGPPPPVDLPTE